MEELREVVHVELWGLERGQEEQEEQKWEDQEEELDNQGGTIVVTAAMSSF